jgi:ubiquinone/menaquinone biosynthesis C-methylase UbiE
LADSGAIEPARSFERAAAAYESARPSYPDALLDLVPVDTSAIVLDLGAGTGKLTRVLARRYRHVIAVEPLDGMRAILESVVPEAESRAGAAESIPLPDSSVDAVFAAQAFHWFANDEAIAEIARVLRAGGVFAVVWNESVDPSPLPDAYRARIKELFADGRLAPGKDEDRFAAIARGPFGELHEQTVMHEQVQDRDSVLAYLSSVSLIARLPDDERLAAMAELRALLPVGEYRFSIRATARWSVRS